MSTPTTSNKSTIYISIAIVTVLVIFIGAFAINKPSNLDTMTKKDSAIMKDGKTMMQKDEAMKDDKMIAQTGSYNDYSVENVAKNPMGTNVIFFHAAWCSSCKSTDMDIKANLSKIPQNFQILKLDYDSSTALRKKYGVTTQHTFVKIDKDGNKLAINQALFTLDEIIDFAK